MEFTDVLSKRRSIRKFKPGAVMSESDIKSILTAAMCAPSACNTRPWEFYVIKDEKTRNELAEIKPQVKNAAAVIVVCALPEVQIGPSEGYWQQDAGAAIENMLLSATDLGYGSCWCGLFPRVERAEMVKKILGTDSLPVAVTVFGESDECPEMRGFYDENKVIIK